jgi:hypothetical protein
MPTPSPAVAHARARVGALSRDRLPDDPEFVAAKRDLVAANLEHRVAEAVATAQLTVEQRSRIAEILHEGTHST